MKIENDFHTTPNNVVLKMINLVNDYQTSFEPFAGNGVFLDHLCKKFPNKMNFFCEIQETLYDVLAEKYTPLAKDVRDVSVFNYFNLVITNPPFTDIEQHIESCCDFVASQGQLILLLPITMWNKVNEIKENGFEIILKEKLGRVNFNGTKVQVFILNAIKTESNDYVPECSLSERENLINKDIQIKLQPDTVFSKVALKMLAEYYGYVPYKIYKTDFITLRADYDPVKPDKNYSEWAISFEKIVEGNYHPVEVRNSLINRRALKYSILFDEHHIPDLNEMLYNGFLNIESFYNYFDSPFVEYERFICQEDNTQSYLDDNFPGWDLEKARNLSYMLYTDCKTYRMFMFGDKRITGRLINELNNILNE